MFLASSMLVFVAGTRHYQPVTPPERELGAGNGGSVYHHWLYPTTSPCKAGFAGGASDSGYKKCKRTSLASWGVDNRAANVAISPEPVLTSSDPGYAEWLQGQYNESYCHYIRCRMYKACN
ncbi:unnamed protein product [Linum trigynum]|uniref:Secreted protein n=1 Tax=Linum trigynum TaxID=586398 RepID=A0AAV2F3R3_9ROSI